MLACENLSCIRAEKTLFSAVSFTLKPGELLILKGANGSGKSSLMRLLAGLIKPAQGQVFWQGQSISANTNYLQEMLYLGHQNALKNELNVYDNLQFLAALKGTEMLVPAALQFFGLWKWAETPVGQLSAGWQRRVALARLLACPCPLWLLDEPAANLDREAQAMLDGLIATRREQEGMVVLTSHSENTQDGAKILNLAEYQAHAA